MARFDKVPADIDRSATFAFVLPNRLTRIIGARSYYTLEVGGEIVWSNGVKYTYEGTRFGSPVFTISRPSKYSEDPILSIETITEEDFLRSVDKLDVGISYLQTGPEAPIEVISTHSDWPLKEVEA